MTAARTVVVAGAGIGGLTAALALAAHGIGVIVLEQAERLEEVGAGLQLSPNASRILIALGLRGALAERAVAPDAISVRAARHGGEIVRIPLGRAAERDGAPYWVIHRADLQAALREAAARQPLVDLRLGTACARFATENDGVRVTTARGDSIAAAALIGADGVHSTVRDRLFPDVRPQSVGTIAWRGTAALERIEGRVPARETRLWLGGGLHMVAYPISAGRAVNIVAFTPGTWRGEDWSAPGAAAELTGILDTHGWGHDARRFIAATEGWTRWALATIDSRRIASRGPVALIGDAAHAMLPFAAQGAGMAIEDAAVLAHQLAATPDDTVAACARYAAARAARVARVQRTAERNGRIYHLQGAAALARNLAMRGLGGTRLLKRQDWIYRWRAEE
jgi:salicylate hydroxylase